MEIRKVLVASIAFTLGASACAGTLGDESAEANDNETNVSTAPLLYTGGARPGRAFRVCYTKDTMEREDFADRNTRTQQAFMGSWTQATGLRFFGFDECPANPDGWSQIAIQLGSGPGGSANPTNSINIQVSAIHHGDRFETVMIHEMGHVLGFQHDPDRADFTDPRCDHLPIDGDTLGTPPDFYSIMSERYCPWEMGNLSHWDKVGTQNLYGRPNYFADLNGDGQSDAIVVHPDGIYVRTSNGTSFDPFEKWSPALPAQRGYYFADVTRDGRADAISVQGNEIFLARSNGAGFDPARSWGGGPIDTARGVYFGDVNADRRADAIIFESGKVRVSLAQQNRFSTQWREWSPNEDLFSVYGTFFVDVTGDRRADAVSLFAGGVVVFPSNGSRFVRESSFNWTGGRFMGQRGTFIADVDGDRRADAIAVNEGGVDVALSDGTKFLAPRRWTDGSFWGERGTFFEDVGGSDGADAIAVNEAGVFIRTADASGTSFPSSTQTNWTGGAYYGLR